MNDIQTRNALAEANDGLAGWTLRYYFPNESWRCIGGFEDALQVARMSLLKAATHFDPSRGRKFSTYAPLCIRREMLKMLEQQGLIRLPGNSQKLKGKNHILLEYRRRARLISSLNDRLREPSSLDTAWGARGTFARRALHQNGLIDKRTCSLELVARKELRDKIPGKLRRIGRKLGYKKARILYWYSRGWNSGEIAKILKVTRQAVHDQWKGIRQRLMRDKELQALWKLFCEE